MELGPEKYGTCSGRTANAGGISWRYSGEARTRLGHNPIGILFSRAYAA